MNSSDIKLGPPVHVGLPSNEELQSIEEAILIEPHILESGMLTIANRYIHEKTEDGMYLTPETVIDIGEGDAAKQATVFVGYAQSNYHRKVIFQKDPSTGQVAEWIVFARKDGVQISDGGGRALESDSDRKKVRSVLDAMKVSYERDVMAVADNFDIKQYLIGRLDERIAAHEVALASLRAQRDKAEHHAQGFDIFKVAIESGWASAGEVSLDEAFSAANVTEALRKATEKFKTVNGRSDVQARDVSLEVSVGEDQYWTIPKEVLAPYFRSLSQWDREAAEIKLAKEDFAKLLK